MRGYAHVIKEDTVAPNLLFLGTEFGLWVSLDGGKQWAQYKGQSFRMSRCATSSFTRANRIWSSPRTAAASGSWTTSRRLRKLTPDVMAQEATFLQANPRSSG